MRRLCDPSRVNNSPKLSKPSIHNSEPVLQTAEEIIKAIANTYPQPNLTPEQIESRAVDGQIL